MCYGQISYIRDKKEFYLVKKHSIYCDNLNKPIPTNIANIDIEINKRVILEQKLFHIIENNPLVNYDEFIKYANAEYNDLKCQFTIYPTSWLNLYKKLRNNSGIFNIDYAVINRFTGDNYLFFRKPNYQINPFKLNNQISKYIIWFSDFFINPLTSPGEAVSVFASPYLSVGEYIIKIRIFINRW